MYWLGSTIGGVAGALTIFLILAAASGYMFWHSKKKPVHAGNVNDDWDGDKGEPLDLVDAGKDDHAPSAQWDSTLAATGAATPTTAAKEDVR